MLGFDANIIERGIRGIFGREFVTRQKKAKYPAFCTIIDSDKEEEKYNSISTLPQLSEIADERVLAGFSEYSYTLKNKLYGTGIKIPRRLFEFDQTGQIRTLVNSLGARTANFPDKLVTDLLTPVAGAYGTCFDQKEFFATDHDLGNGVDQSNNVAGYVSNTYVNAYTKSQRDDAIAAFIGALNLAKSTMLEFADDRGEPWHEDAEPAGLIIICHPRMEWLARTALEAAIVQDSGNVFLKTIGKVITLNRPGPFVGSDGSTVYYGTFYLAKIDTVVQPLIFQRFGPKQDFPDSIPEADQAPLQALSSIEIQSVMRTGSQVDAHTFFDDEFLFGARCIYAAGFGMWQNMVRVKASDYS